MTSYKYKCTYEDYIDYNFYLAVHDNSMQKRLIYFVVGFWAAAILLKLIYFPSVEALYITLGLCIAYGFIMPKIYWVIVLKRISIETKKISMHYPEIQLEIKDKITISENGKEINVEFRDISNIGWTKSTCFVFYSHNEKKLTIIIPLRFIENLQEFAIAIERGA